MRNKIILIVVVLVGLAIAIIVPNVIRAKDNEKASNTIAQIKNIGRVIDNYRNERGVLPAENEIMQAGAKDGWGNKILYKLSSNKESYFLASQGKDGKFEGWDRSIKR